MSGSALYRRFCAISSRYNEESQRRVKCDLDTHLQIKFFVPLYQYRVPIALTLMCTDCENEAVKIPTALVYSSVLIWTYIFALARNVFRILALTLVQVGGGAGHIGQNVLHEGGHTLRLLVLRQADVVLRRA